MATLISAFMPHCLFPWSHLPATKTFVFTIMARSGIQNNLPVSISLTQSQLQRPFCSVSNTSLGKKSWTSLEDSIPPTISRFGDSGHYHLTHCRCCFCYVHSDTHTHTHTHTAICQVESFVGSEVVRVWGHWCGS